MVTESALESMEETTIGTMAKVLIGDMSATTAGDTTVLNTNIHAIEGIIAMILTTTGEEIKVMIVTK